MIPQTIHYCWFGGKPLPRSAQRCIASWRKFFPDYAIREWNERNFDVTMVPYTAEAHAAMNYAFVSDFARFWILYHQGGVYFDTDVEVIRPMDDLVERGAFLGMEARTQQQQSRLYVNPGLGCACEAGNGIWGEVLKKYQAFEHFDPDGQGTVCTITSDMIEQLGTTLGGQLTQCGNVTIYPAEYFCPQARMGAPIDVTKNTRSIHHFDGTWLPAGTRLRMRLAAMLPCQLRSWLREVVRERVGRRK